MGKRVIGCGLAVILLAALVHSQGGVDVAIDAAANRHAIDERIYGLAFADSSTMTDLRTSLARWGGNGTTRYNWQANASNHASDWYFESIPDSSATPGDSADSFISQALSSGARPSMTIPTIGWVAKLGPNRSILPGFSVAKYGPQTGVDPFLPDAGNGVSAMTGQAITGNDPNDANAMSNSTFQRSFVQHLVSRWGGALAGGVRYYTLDNEPSIWHSTHRDVHPTGATMDEIANDFRDYGAMIKAVDGGALILGPEEWGWSGYLYSGYDQQWGGQHGWSFLPDRAAHGNADYLPWFLDQMHQNEIATGQRLLDILTVHFYPQGGEFSNDTSPGMQQLRNRSTRALWDPNYVDESWIGTQVQLVPRLKDWVTTHYPGTKVGITEYNWGAEGHINGATTLADILGIFGREGLDMASYWTAPDPSTPTYKAIKLYRNYDNVGSGFGDTSVSAVAPDPDSLAVFAALRQADGALTLMVVNKVTSDTVANLHLANFNAGGSAQVWQLTAANAITHLPDAVLSTSPGLTLTATLPAQSVTLFVVPPAVTVTLKVNGLHPTPPVVTTSGPYNLTMTIPPTTYSGAVDVYWALVVNGSLLWVTSTGISTVAAPVFHGPVPVWTNMSLINATLPSGATITAAVLIVGGNALVSSDVITAQRPTFTGPTPRGSN